MEKLLNFVKECVSRKIAVSVCIYDAELAFEIHGFYKSGTVTLFRALDDKIYAKARYDEVTEIETFDDLVTLNWSWWNLSKERYDGWKNPDNGWVEDMIRLGLVKVKTTTVYE